MHPISYSFTLHAPSYTICLFIWPCLHFMDSFSLIFHHFRFYSIYTLSPFVLGWLGTVSISVGRRWWACRSFEREIRLSPRLWHSHFRIWTCASNASKMRSVYRGRAHLIPPLVSPFFVCIINPFHLPLSFHLIILQNHGLRANPNLPCAASLRARKVPKLRQLRTFQRFNNSNYKFWLHYFC